MGKLLAPSTKVREGFSVPGKPAMYAAATTVPE